MATLIKFIIGLPGSGKTYYLNKLDETWFKIDDPKDISILPNDIDKIAIADPWFCVPNILNKAIEVIKLKYKECDIELVYFENNVDKCRNNVKFRNDGRLVDNFITLLAKTYQPPKNSLKIFDGDENGCV